MYRGEPAIDRAGGGDGNRSAGDPRRVRSPRRHRASAAADLPADADGEEEPYGEEEEDDGEEAYVVLDVQPRTRTLASTTTTTTTTTRVCCNDDFCRCRAAQKRPGRRRRGSGNALRIFFVAAAAAFLTLAVSPGTKLAFVPRLYLVDDDYLLRRADVVRFTLPRRCLGSTRAELCSVCVKRMPRDAAVVSRAR